MMCFRSDDELFHVTLYSWLLSVNLSERLVEVGSSLPVLSACSLCTAGIVVNIHTPITCITCEMMILLCVDPVALH